MGTVVQFPRHRIVRELPIGRRKLSMLIGRSPRWIQQAVNEPERVGARDPMPHERLPNGYLRFLPSEVEAWLDERKEGAA